ncbi:hypothetical protein LCGC14_1687310 [marine sediment metagenome]|uniref:Uncharacterized protein n=1 Tax=marine sediment metagenome TaxID=412755 RepID=A0A0F9HLX5_9ZZZZ
MGNIGGLGNLGSLGKIDKIGIVDNLGWSASQWVSQPSTMANHTYGGCGA